MILSLLLSSAFAADLELPAPSPKAMVMQTIGTVEVSVTYSSPGKKGRDVFGALVPYDELWRTGANRATVLSLSGDAKIGGQKVPAGDYAVFTEPHEDTWTVILNSNTKQGGTGSYDKALDVARFDVKPVETAALERLTFLFVDTTDDSAVLHLSWDGVAVPIAVEVDSTGRAKASIDDFVDDAGWQLVNAAKYHHQAGDHARALELVDKGLSVDETWYGLWFKAQILKGLGENKAAYKTLKTAKAMGDQADNFFYAGRVKKALDTWPKK